VKPDKQTSNRKPFSESRRFLKARDRNRVTNDNQILITIVGRSMSDHSPVRSVRKVRDEHLQ
jgi:hypothetical protein